MTFAREGRGRPLRFLALVVTGWIGVRIALLWPQTGSLPAAIKALAAPQVEAETVVAAIQPAEHPAVPHRQHRAVHAQPVAPPVAPVSMIETPPPAPALGIVQIGVPATLDITAPPADIPPVQTTFVPTTSRWSGSAWLMVRPGSGLSAAPGGQIGGSQGGVRIAYTLDRRHRLALFGRFVTPLSGPGREAAAGIEWQPTRAPVRIVAEHRVPLDGGKGGPGIGLVMGDDTQLPLGFRLESYGQTGAIHRSRIEPYADGAARVTRRIPGTPVALGAGAWGAAQRGATRMDIGPSATVAVPVAGQRLRIALDWRQRVAGDARPDSGVALTLGSDF